MEQTANALPPVTLGQYKGLPVTRRVRPVTEAAVASELKSLARRHAPFCATSAPAARGMRVTLDFEGFLDGAPIPDSRMEQVTVTLGTAQLMPAAELDQNADHALQQLKDKLSRSRFSLELYCQANNTTPEQLRAGYRQDAARRMRAMLAVPAIAQAENITVSNEEVDAEYARLARLHGNPEEEIRRVLARDAVAAALTNQKVQRFLLDHAAVTSIVEKE